MTIEISVNGEIRRLPEGRTVADLIALLQLEPRRLAVERNREVVPKAAYATTTLVAGDRLEIVGFVGGG